jgi:hypothetical protein
MKYFTRLSSSNYYNTACECKYPGYLFSPFIASLITGSIFSIIIKEHIHKKLLYVERQNDEIIARLKNLQKI